MKTLKTEINWIDHIILEGLPLNSSTIITGPGGSYGDSILDKIKETIIKDKSRSYIFSVNTSAKAEKISKIEDVADNLILSHSEKKPFRLFIKILRMKGVRYNQNEFLVPILPKVLKHIKKIADHSRKIVITAISKI